MGTVKEPSSGLTMWVNYHLTATRPFCILESLGEFGYHLGRWCDAGLSFEESLGEVNSEVGVLQLMTASKT
jgi:hypothetical protein